MRTGISTSCLAAVSNKRIPDAATDPAGIPAGTLSRLAYGLLALGEVRLPPLTSGPNLHVHANEDEMFFMLDGVMTVQVADKLYEIAAGGLAWGARGIQHAFANRATDPLHIMIMWIPGGAEGLFQEMREYLQTVDGAPDPQAVAEIQARYGCTQVGPRSPFHGCRP